MDLQILEASLLRPPYDLTHLTAEEQFARIKDKAALGHSIVTEAGLLERLKESRANKKPLRIKFGIDPTGPEIHIGHAVSFINLRRLLRMGHEIHIIIGDFTAMVGDPGERMDSRPPLSSEQVRENMASYAAQASRVLDLQAPHVHLHYNSAWLGKHSLSKWLSITKGISVNSLLQREDFRKRIDSGMALSLAEFEYALLMGYDSVELKPDIEVGGMDQFLNFHFCRQMMEQAGQRPECFITFDLLPGTTGEKDSQGRLGKMSKSRANYIPVETPAKDMYGKVMSIPDEVMWVWFRELTEASSADIKWLKAEVESGKLHPKDAKQLLARVVVATFHPHEPGAVEGAEKDFNSKFGKTAELRPTTTLVYETTPGDTQPLRDSLSQITNRSKSDLARMLDSGGIGYLPFDASNYDPINMEQFIRPSGVFGGGFFKVGKKDYIEFRIKP